MNSQSLRNKPDDNPPAVKRIGNPVSGGFAVGAATIALMLAVPAGPAAADPTPRGRIHLDYAVHDSDATELNDGSFLRRARIGVADRLDDIWQYQIEIDFAENDVEAKDVFLRHNRMGGGKLTIGQVKVPFSLEELTSSNNITFIERSSPNVFALSRRTGVHWGTGGDRHTVAVMGFGQAIGAGGGGDEGLGLAARATYLPLMTDSGLLHIGAAVAHYEPEQSNADTLRYRQRPESRPDGTRLVDTGNIADADSALSYGLEAAWLQGPFSVQGEYIGTGVTRDVGADADFDGWYIYGSYFLTGESRRYSGGAFSGPKIIDASRGAWELAARYSNLNLDDGAILGGEMNNFTVGVNWYARSNVRFMLNYIAVDTEQAGVEDNPSIVVARTQVSF